MKNKSLRSKKKIRIGLLLNSYEVPAWFFESIKQLKELDICDFVLIVKNSVPKKSFLRKIWINRTNLLYYIHSKIDKFLFPSKSDSFSSHNILELIDNPPIIETKPTHTKYRDNIPQIDIDKIKLYDVDIFIRGGFRILDGEILDVPKYGIWSYHHGDNRVNRGGPPGFWETISDNPTTGVIIQILNKNLDGGKVLVRSFISTNKYSISRNKNELYWHSVSLLSIQINFFYDLGPKAFFKKVKEKQPSFDIYDSILYKKPGNIKALQIMFAHFLKLFKITIQKLLFRNQWFLMYKLNKTDLSFRNFISLFPPRDKFWADPFVIEKGKDIFVFFEEYSYRKGRAHISFIRIDSSGKLDEAKKILEEDYHLSYPFLLKLNNNYYMVPESSSNKSIDIYECGHFPELWNFKMTLINNINAVDSTFHYKDGYWWMFTTVRKEESPSVSNELHIYYSENILSSDWIPHPLNPVITDVRKSRSAGNFFEIQGKLYRPSQDCSVNYGSAVNLNEVLILNKNNYLEKAVGKIRPKWDKDVKGIHTFSTDNNIVVVDVLRSQFRFL